MKKERPSITVVIKTISSALLNNMANVGTEEHFYSIPELLIVGPSWNIWGNASTNI